MSFGERPVPDVPYWLSDWSNDQVAEHAAEDRDSTSFHHCVRRNGAPYAHWLFRDGFRTALRREAQKRRRSPTELQAEKWVEAMLLRSEGLSFFDIGRRLHCSSESARKWVLRGRNDPVAYSWFVVRSLWSEAS